MNQEQEYLPAERREVIYAHPVQYSPPPAYPPHNNVQHVHVHHHGGALSGLFNLIIVALFLVAAYAGYQLYQLPDVDSRWEQVEEWKTNIGEILNEGMGKAKDEWNGLGGNKDGDDIIGKSQVNPLRLITSLDSVHPDLVRIYRLAQKKTKFDIRVVESFRTEERQYYLFHAKNGGKSVTKTLNSRHLNGRALDLEVRYSGKRSNKKDWQWCRRINKAMQEAAKELQIPLEWGGSWKSLPDGYHYQLPWKYYKTGYKSKSKSKFIKVKTSEPVLKLTAKRYWINYLRGVENQYGLPRDLLTTIAMFESSLGEDPDMNKGSYVGMFQVGIPAGIDNGLVKKKKGKVVRDDRRSHYKSAHAIAKQMTRFITKIESKLGIKINDRNSYLIYMIHNQGYCGVRIIKAISNSKKIPVCSNGKKHKKRTIYRHIKKNLSKPYLRHVKNEKTATKRLARVYLSFMASHFRKKRDYVRGIKV